MYEIPKNYVTAARTSKGDLSTFFVFTHLVFHYCPVYLTAAITCKRIKLNRQKEHVIFLGTFLVALYK